MPSHHKERLFAPSRTLIALLSYTTLPGSLSRPDNRAAPTRNGHASPISREVFSRRLCLRPSSKSPPRVVGAVEVVSRDGALRSRHVA